MAKFSLDTDFSALNPAQATKWMCEFCEMVEEAFAQQDNDTRLLGHLLLLELQTNTVRQGLREHNRTLSPLIAKGLDQLWDHLEKTGEVDQALASDLYGCVLCNQTGEELTDAQEAFYQEHFSQEEPTAD